MGFDPSWGLKYPQGTPGLIPPVYVFSRQLTKIQILFVNFVHFCSFPYIIIFLALFWPFLNPTLYLILGLGSPYGPKLLNLSRDCWFSQKTDLDYWICYGFSIFSLLWPFLAIFLPLEGPLRATSNSWGPPRPPISSLTSRDTLPPGLVPTKRALFLDSVMVFQFF